VHISTLLKKALNVKESVVENICIERDHNGEYMVMEARPLKKLSGRCGKCGHKAQGYDAGTKGRHWRATDMGSMRAYIKCDVPRVYCNKHGVVASAVPWARHGSMFTIAFEDTVIWLAKHSSKSVVSRLMRIDWATVGAIIKRLVDDIEKAVQDCFDGLMRIGIDETSYKKGHKYMTVIINHDTGALIWACPGYGKKVLSGFFDSLTNEQRQSILHVSADGARWIAECVAKYCPNANRCIDPFHVVSWAMDALDEVRKGVWRDARVNIANASKQIKPGRSKKGEERKVNTAKIAKGLRYALFKNPENRTLSQVAKIEMIAKTNPKLYRAYLLKEGLRTVFRLSKDEAVTALAAWIKWAQHCRLPQFIELQRKIRRHQDAILASIEQGLSNARVEAINNKIKGSSPVCVVTNQSK
jgi:transposase